MLGPGGCVAYTADAPVRIDFPPCARFHDTYIPMAGPLPSRCSLFYSPRDTRFGPPFFRCFTLFGLFVDLVGRSALFVLEFSDLDHLLFAPAFCHLPSDYPLTNFTALLVDRAT